MQRYILFLELRILSFHFFFLNPEFKYKIEALISFMKHEFLCFHSHNGLDHST